MNQKLTVLIAEDELLIRMGIKLSCDWEKLGMQVAEDVSDGETAWASYQRLKPDIVLIDVRMPGIDGIELARRIRQSDALCRIIVISCVDEFTTLHQLTHLGITDYLLKLDMTPDSLAKALQKARTEWLALNPKQRTSPPQNFTPSFETQYLLALYSSALTSQENSMLLPTLEKILAEQIPGPLKCQAKSQSAALCLVGQLTASICFQERLERVQAHFQRVFGLPLSIFGAQIYPNQTTDANFDALNHLYDQGYWFRSPVAQWEPNREWLHTEKLKNIAFYGSNPEILSSIPKGVQSIWIEQISTLPLSSIDEFQNALMNLMLNLTLRILRLSTPDLGQIHAAVMTAHTAWGALEACVQLIEQQVYQSLGARVKRPEIRLALSYINDHFAESLSSAQVAEQVGLSPHYFLNVFKKETGMTFVGYLNHYRIERAKALLEETGLYAYEIASQCGFSDAAYFSRIFKQITGVHPRYYRQCGEEEES